jgi:hypothetical protein
MIERADTNEANLGTAAILAPQGHFALWAAIDVVRAISAPHRNRLQLSTKNLDSRGFDNRVEHESAARVPLTIRAMAAMHSDGLIQQTIAHLAAGAAAGEFLFHLRFTISDLREWGIRPPAEA